MARREYQGKVDVALPIDEILEQYNAWADEIVEAVSKEAVKEIKRFAPLAYTRETGGLDKSIKRKKSKIKRGMAVAGAFAPHAHLIEFGHNIVVGKNGNVVGHVAAQPFVRPAEQAVRDRLSQIVNEVMKDKTVVVKS